MALIEGKTSGTETTPVWLIAFAGLMIALRVFVKLPEQELDKVIPWISAGELSERLKNEKDGRDLVLYDFMADWCPPCRKMDRTTFRAPEIVNDIKKNFIAVRVNLADKRKEEEALNKELTGKFSVYRIPTAVVTLATGEYVMKDWLWFDYKTFLADAKERASLVKCEIKLARGDCQGAMKEASNRKLSGELAIGSVNELLVYHHLLSSLERGKEAEVLVEKTCERRRNDKNKSKDWMIDVCQFLSGKIKRADLFERAGSSDNCKAQAYLALALQELRNAAGPQSVKDFRHAALLSARSYSGDKFAEYCLDYLDK
jgi:thiol-disulfide isomerase/thioredoxin